MDDLELTITRIIATPREKVFDAWLSPALLAQFMRVPSGEGGPAKVKTDAVKGGRFSIIMVTQEREIPHTGTYLEIRPHSHLAFTWESPYSLGDSVVTVDLAAPDDNSTEITLRHVKFRSEQARDGHEEGWSAILESMAATLA